MKPAQSRYRLRLVVLTILALVALLVPTAAFAAPIQVSTESANQHYGCAAYHTVRPGDTLSQIAKWYGVSMQSIMNANGIVNASRIFIGETLCIPASGGGGGAPGGCAVVHTVRPGDTLSQIARWYGVSMWDIMNANGMTDPNHIWIGQQLCIPGGGSAPPPPPQPAPPSGCWQWYTVQAGDTLTKIAGWYGTTVQYIMQINGLSTTTIWVGQQLKVPVACNPAPQPPPCNCPPPPPPPCQCPPPPPPPPPTPVPCNCPTPVPPQPSGTWLGEYYNNTTLSEPPVFTNNVNQMAFNWGQGGLAMAWDRDFFSTRFTQQLWFDAGTYRFYATSDDGVRVWVNNQLVIDGWRVQAATSYFGDIVLPSNNANIRVEYFEDTGDAVLYVNWTRLQ